MIRNKDFSGDASRAVVVQGGRRIFASRVIVVIGGVARVVWELIVSFIFTRDGFGLQTRDGYIIKCKDQ